MHPTKEQPTLPKIYQTQLEHLDYDQAPSIRRSSRPPQDQTSRCLRVQTTTWRKQKQFGYPSRFSKNTRTVAHRKTAAHIDR